MEEKQNMGYEYEANSLITAQWTSGAPLYNCYTIFMLHNRMISFHSKQVESLKDFRYSSSPFLCSSKIFQ